MKKQQILLVIIILIGIMSFSTEKSEEGFGRRITKLTTDDGCRWIEFDGPGTGDYQIKHALTCRNPFHGNSVK